MTASVVLHVERFWECPNCSTRGRTVEVRPHTEFHNCPGLFGLSAPMVQAGTKCKIEAIEREDYIGREDVRYDGNGRPIMAVVTTRNDGNDVVVYAPTAYGSTREDRRG